MSLSKSNSNSLMDSKSLIAGELPKHLAIIMDGNGRWANLRNKSRIVGHVKGTRVAKDMITECSRLGIKYLTLYAFSTENWLRPKAEVSFLMKILRRYLKKETQNLVKENIQFSIIGELNRLPEDVIEAIKTSMKATEHCTGLKLVFAISYGSRLEITDAVRVIAQKIQNGEVKSTDIDENMISKYLSSYPAPDPDLIIRTSGEQRLSNFLMWQAAYSEFYFTETLWPDFKRENLILALNSYMSRQRRFGQTTEQIKNEIISY